MALDQSNSQSSAGSDQAPPRDDHCADSPRPRRRLWTRIAQPFKQGKRTPQDQRSTTRDQRFLDNEAQIIRNLQTVGLLSPPRPQQDQLPTIPEDPRAGCGNLDTLQHPPQPSATRFAMPTQHLQPPVHQRSASANNPKSNSSASNSATHKKSASSNDAAKSTTKRIPSPKTPPGQTGPKGSDGCLSPSSQACESADVSPSQEGVKRSERKVFHSPPGTAGLM